MSPVVSADPSVATRLNNLVSGLQAATREVTNICEERQSESHEILVKSETLYRSEKFNLEQWEFLKNDLIRKESDLLSFFGDYFRCGPPIIDVLYPN